MLRACCTTILALLCDAQITSHHAYSAASVAGDIVWSARAVSFGTAPASAHEPCKFLDETAVNGPCYVSKPSAGPVGTRVHFLVRVPPQYQGGWFGETWKRHPFLRMFKLIPQNNEPRCMFIVPSRPAHWHIVPLEPKEPQQAVRQKAVVGWLTVGDSGSCQGGRLQRVTPGRYLLSTSWRHGAFVRIRVTTGELPATGAYRLAGATVLGALLVMVGSGLFWGYRGLDRNDDRTTHPRARS